MFTTKNIYRNSWLLHLIVWLGVFSACTEIDDEPAMVKTRSLTMSRIAIADNVNVQTARVLVFDEYGALVTNIGPISNLEQDANNDNILNINTTNETDKILAKVGKNSVYVVLNEAAGITTDESNNVTWNLTAQLNAVKTKTEMETLRNTPIEYKEVIAVEGDTEPAFLMCVYDDEVIVTNQTETLDLTGLDEGDYGFSIHRTMAKIVLESVVGGVKPDGTIVGTDNIKWDGNIKKDQIIGDTNNEALIATSAVHILSIELINIPTHYSWKQEKNTSASPYTGNYLPESIPVAASDFNLSERYFEREWPGLINGSGEVEFTRTDAMYSMWKIKENSGSKAYEVYDPEDIAANPDAYYYWGITGGSTPVPSNGITCEITYADAMKTATNYSHYKIDENGIIHLFDTSGKEFDAPNNSLYTLNKGNFISFFQDNYGNMSGNFVPGRPIAGAMKTTPNIDPSVWSLRFNNVSYYIPENISSSPSNHTKLRVTASIAIPTVELDADEVNKAINEQGGSGELVGEEGKIDMSDENIINYLYAKGEMLPHPTKEGYYALAYAGLQRMYKGTVIVTNAKGRYEKMAGYDAQIVTIEIPLTNDEYENNENLSWEYDSNTDHNIYRGREYHVKLYVTKQGAWNNQTNTASRTINIGGEELTITGKVVTKPMK